MSPRRQWLDTHIHVSNYDPDEYFRGDILDDILEVIDGSGADLRWVISVDMHWINRMVEQADQVVEANRFIHDLVERAPGRLFGACTVNPHFLDASLEAMRLCFEEWGFILFGEMLPYLMDYRMNTDPVAELVRAALAYDVPTQIHISTSNSGPQGPFPGGGTEQLEDFMDLAERVPEAKFILAHFIGTPKEPPVVDGYLDQIEKRYGEFPGNYWAEIRDFNSPGVASALRRIPVDRLMPGTDWVTRIGPPFLPYGVIFNVEQKEDDPYRPSVDSMVACLREAGASETDIDRIAYLNAHQLLLEE